MAKKDIKKIQESLIHTGIKIARKGNGALFVIGETEYEPLVDQKVPSFNIIENQKLLESLAIMDGAVIIDREGMMKAYGVMIKTDRTFKGHGTRHSAGLSAAKGSNIVVLVSEEDRKVKILKKGKLIMQIDALQKGVEDSIPKAVDLLESVGAGTIGAIGTSLLIPALGIAFLPGVVIFGSLYYIGKILKRKHKA